MTRVDDGVTIADGARGGYAEMLVGSLTVLGLICLAAYLIVRLVGRRGSTMRSSGMIDVVARASLEPRRSLYVVEVGGKTLLVGASELGLALLTELDGTAVRPAAVGSQSTGGFVDAVRAAIGRRSPTRGEVTAHRVDHDGARGPEGRVPGSTDADGTGPATADSGLARVGGVDRATVGAVVHDGGAASIAAHHVASERPNAATAAAGVRAMGHHE